MWHEARKQERKIRGMLVDYRKRAERRRDFYEKIKADPTQFLQIHGRQCKIHLDPAIAAAAEGPATMMPWQGQNDNLIDRFDVRAHLDYIPPVTSKADEEVTSEERQLNYERYRIIAQNAFLGINEEKFLKQLHLEEQFGYTENEPKKKKPTGGAAIGFTYEDSTPGGTSFPTAASSNLAAGAINEEEASDDNSDSDLDVDLSINISKIDSAQAHEMNRHGRNFGMSSNDFYSFLTNDLEEAESFKLAKEEEHEKALFSGRKSRRERRAHREKRLANRKISPPSYAAKESPSVPVEMHENSESRSPSPENTGKITFITSFGDDEEPQMPAKPTYADKVKFGTKLKKLRQENYDRKVFIDSKKESTSFHSSKRNRSTSRNRKLRSRRSSTSSSSSSRSRSRSKSRSRSRSRSKRQRTMRRHSISSSSSSSSYDRRKKRRNSRNSRSNNYIRKRRSTSRSQSSTSRSRSKSSSRSSKSRSRSRSKSKSKSKSKSRSRSTSSCKSREPERLRSASRSRSKSKSRSKSPLKKHFEETNSKIATIRDQDNVTNSTVDDVDVLHEKNFNSVVPKDAAILNDGANRVQKVEEHTKDKEEVRPLPRYYGRRKSDQSSSEIGDSSDEDSNESPKNTQTNNSNLKIGNSGTATKGGAKSAATMSLAERLKRKRQALLNKQFKADKIAEQMKSEREKQEQQTREDELRELALKLRKKARERRNVYDSSSSGSSSSSRSKSRSNTPKNKRSPSGSPKKERGRSERRSERDRDDYKDHARWYPGSSRDGRDYDRDRGRDYERERERDRESARERDRDRSRSRDRERDRDRNRERDRDRDWERSGRYRRSRYEEKRNDDRYYKDDRRRDGRDGRERDNQNQKRSLVDY